ncbi:hypothetical protein AAG570_011734 [Ranatra chinensis]|uniref:Uncharacterized protein n=1 Tax=Ranatra chinensis TaxID=642074 RepID=A0ABD0YGQ5_9HEMI
MLFEFRKGIDETIFTKTICDVYPNALDVRKSYGCFPKSDPVILTLATRIDQEDQQRERRMRQRIENIGTVRRRGEGSARWRDDGMLALGGHRLSECDLVCDEVPGDVDWSVAQVEDDQEGGGVARLTHVGLPKELLECGLEDDSVPSVTPPISATYGEIVIRDSTDVHIGNKTFYNGAVTIKQFVFPPKGEEEDVKKLPQGNGTLARSQTHLCEPPPGTT